MITLLFLALGVSSVVAAPDEDNEVVSEKTVLAAIQGDASAKSELQKKDKFKVRNRLQRIVPREDLDRSTTDMSTVHGALEMIKTTPNAVDYFRDKSLTIDPVEATILRMMHLIF